MLLFYMENYYLAPFQNFALLCEDQYFSFPVSAKRSFFFFISKYPLWYAFYLA